MGQTADVLFSKTQQRVLRALFAGEGEALTYSEILRRAGGGSGAIHRELAEFVAAGLVLEEGGGARRAYAANARHPLYAELRALAHKLFPPPALDPLVARTLAGKYMWWEQPEIAARQPERLAAQVMRLGTFEDARLVESALGVTYLRRVLRQAAPGWFDEPSWAYWHYRLGLARPGRVPPLPRRRLE